MVTVSPCSGASSWPLVKEAFLFSDGSVMNDFDRAKTKSPLGVGGKAR
jgi:hypothetical protein